ncbi:N-acetyltransferase [Ramlibacter tataouinensis]|uniref:N-acetyltransferase n=1 Tax=Ramlibacter tataouinensis TaxID=94132 RepID=UPI0022F3F534|nr:N-acetyltransferase [Ramlibacter tataouinensis]WBY01990.1 N-acetyltransferase [Ramlibacter tataouinensis]
MTQDAAPHLMPAAWEVGRLVVAPEYRAGPEALKRCLFLTLAHLLDHLQVENLFATCTPLLGRLYRRFGFSVLLKDAFEGEDGSYSLIHGDVATVFRALAGSEQEQQQAQLRLAALRPH